MGGRGGSSGLTSGGKNKKTQIGYSGGESSGTLEYNSHDSTLEKQSDLWSDKKAHAQMKSESRYDISVGIQKFMDGSEKQNRYAEKIISKKVDNEVSGIISRIRMATGDQGMGVDKAKFTAVKNQLKSAGVNVNSQNDIIAYTVKNSPRIKELLSNKSAKSVLNKYA